MVRSVGLLSAKFSHGAVGTAVLLRNGLLRSERYAKVGLVKLWQSR